ncbi:hypothetical protein F2P79_009196 [Pimephales promelas]|nr:hypothetical protein F2P79_009196 [Pimephales promelas]
MGQVGMATLLAVISRRRTSHQTFTRIERTLRNQQPSCVPEGKPQPSNFQVAKQVLEEQVKWILLGKQRPWFQVFM